MPRSIADNEERVPFLSVGSTLLERKGLLFIFTDLEGPHACFVKEGGGEGK